MEQLSKLKFVVQQVELKMADIEQVKKIVPLITCEIPFSQHVCELMFGVSVTDLDLALFWAARPLPPSRLTGGIATPTRRYHGRMLIHSSPPACPSQAQRCLHTRKFGTLTSPPPPIDRMPWDLHLPGHAVWFPDS